MIRILTALAALLPGSAMAHGLHPEVPEAGHALAHVAPLAVIAVCALAAWYLERGHEG